MFRVATTTAVTSLPVNPGVEGEGGFFQPGVKGTGEPATVPGYAWFNRVQEELVNVIKICHGLSDEEVSAFLNKENNRQVADAILGAIAATMSTVQVGGHGECRLALSGTDLKLSRFNGKSIRIDGVSYDIPSAGVTLAPGGLSADVTYYIYAYMAGDPTTMTLEASTTGHVAHTDGVEIKSGDSSRTLVGMARPVTGPVWVDSDQQVFVLSYFNRKKKTGFSSLTADRTTSSNTLVEINSEIRVEFLTWGDFEGVSNGITNSSGAYIHSYQISIDGGVLDRWVNMRQAATGTNKSESFAYRNSKESEGYHYSTLLTSTNAGTMTLYGGATDTQNKKVYQSIAVKG